MVEQVFQLSSGSGKIIERVQETHEYGTETILKIPFQTKMNVRNQHDETLELMIVKVPAPGN